MIAKRAENFRSVLLLSALNATGSCVLFLKFGGPSHAKSSGITHVFAPIISHQKNFRQVSNFKNVDFFRIKQLLCLVSRPSHAADRGSPEPALFCDSETFGQTMRFKDHSTLP
jgi:hypothetical protein